MMMIPPEQYGYYYYPPPLLASSSHYQAPEAPAPYFHNTEYPQQHHYPMPTPSALNYPNHYNGHQTTDTPQMPIHKPEMPPLSSPTITTQVPHTSNTKVCVTRNMCMTCTETFK